LSAAPLKREVLSIRRDRVGRNSALN